MTEAIVYFGRVVHDDLDAGRSLQGADVAAFAADDASLDFVILDREGGDGIFDGRLRGGTLDGIDDDALGFLGGIEPGFVHRVIDIGLGFGTGLGFHIVDQHLAGLLRRHPGDALQLLVDLRRNAVALLEFGVQLVLERIDLTLLGIQVVLAAVQLIRLLVELALAGLDVVLALAQLVVFLVDEILVLALELKEFLLGLEDFLLFEILGLQVGLLDDGVGTALRSGAAHQYINCKGQGGACNCS